MAFHLPAILSYSEGKSIIQIGHVILKEASTSFKSFWQIACEQAPSDKGKEEGACKHRPISLLPICGKIFEKLIFDAIYEYLCKNQLLTPSQSGSRPGDSTVNQLFSITHKIYFSFEEFPFREARAIFLDISKAFDKVWQDGLLFKLESYGISGCLFTLIKDFLGNRQQRVVLNGKSSGWPSVTTGVPQGSALGSLFFLVYINDLVDNISSEARLFAGDTFLFTVVYDAGKLNRDLDVISNWAHQWRERYRNHSPFSQICSTGCSGPNI